MAALLIFGRCFSPRNRDAFRPQILTKDSVTVSVDGVVYFRVSDPIASVANVVNADFSTRLLAQTTLRNVLGTKNLAELLSDREGIAHSMQVCLHSAVNTPTMFAEDQHQRKVSRCQGRFSCLPTT